MTPTPTGTVDNPADLAKKLRVYAALPHEDTVEVHFTPTMAKRTAHAIDGGGFVHPIWGADILAKCVRDTEAEIESNKEYVADLEKAMRQAAWATGFAVACVVWLVIL